MSLYYPNNSSKLRKMVLFSLLGAILVIFKEVNPIRYNIEFVSTLIIAYTCVFGWYALIPTYIFVAIEQILYGFNIWTYFYLYAWAILVLISFPFRKLRSPILWAMIAGVFGLSFGALSAITSYFIGGWGAAVAYWTSGLWFDLTHCVGNFIITLLLCYPLRILLEKGKETLKI